MRRRCAYGLGLLVVTGWLALNSVRAESDSAAAARRAAAASPATSSPPRAAPASDEKAPDTAPAAARFAPTSEYRVEEIEGWQVVVHRSLFQEQAELGARTLRHLRAQLYQIVHRLPQDAVGKLRQVKIWVEFQDPNHPCMCYHPDVNWLREHGMNPAKAKCVELANSETFLKWTVQQPWMVLHELAHAYHDQFLDKGYGNEAVRGAFRRSEEANRYASVLRINGRKDRHYAATNPMEYFAEATEAFFGTNDFFPFVRAELAEHDPEMFELLQRLWGEVPEKPQR